MPQVICSGECSVVGAGGGVDKLPPQAEEESVLGVYPSPQDPTPLPSTTQHTLADPRRTDSSREGIVLFIKI